MDLVDEEDVPLLEVGQQGGQVPGPHQHGAGGDPEPRAHLGGDDAGQGCLAQSGRPGKEQVVGGLLPLEGGLDHDPEVLGELSLAHELRECAGPQAGVVGLLGGRGDRRQKLGEPFLAHAHRTILQQRRLGRAHGGFPHEVRARTASQSRGAVDHGDVGFGQTHRQRIDFSARGSAHRMTLHCPSI